MNMKMILSLNLATVFSLCAFAENPGYDRAAARAAYFKSLTENANPAIAEQIAEVRANPTYLSHGAQDNAEMKRQIKNILVENDVNHQANLDRNRAASLAPYIGTPGRAMDASEIPDFDSDGYYFIPGFGQVQIPLTQEQMDIYNEVRDTGYAPSDAGQYLRMLGITN